MQQLQMQVVIWSIGELCARSTMEWTVSYQKEEKKKARSHPINNAPIYRCVDQRVKENARA
jgi:hypothetical protein